MKRILHLYNLTAGRCNLIFVIALVPHLPHNQTPSTSSADGYYCTDTFNTSSIDPINAVQDLFNFTLFSKSGNIERKLCAPLQLKLAFDPRDAEFDVCLLPKEHSLPPDSHYSVRIWIRRSASARPRSFPFVQVGPLNPIYRHRLFSDEDFYIARFPLDIYATRPSPPPVPPRSPPGRGAGPVSPVLAPAGGGTRRTSITIPPQPTVLAIPQTITDNVHILSAKLNGVSIRYIVAIASAVPNEPGGSEYLISLEYEAGGITRYLVRNIDLRITCPLSELGFTIYTNFLRQTSTGTLYHLSFWICSPQPSTSSPPPREEDSRILNGVCQRLWRTDSFLVTSPVLALPRSGSTPSLPGAPGPEAMIVAQKHTRSPLAIDLPDPPESGSPFDDPLTNSWGGARGSDRGASGASAKETEAGIGEGAWEWELPDGVSGGGSELPTYTYSQPGHGRHSGAFEDDDGEASIEALVRRMH